MEKQKTTHDVEQNPGPLKKEMVGKEEGSKVELPNPSKLGKRILEENHKLFLHPVVKAKRMRIIEDLVIKEEDNNMVVDEEDEEYLQLYQEYQDLLNKD